MTKKNIEKENESMNAFANSTDSESDLMSDFTSSPAEEGDEFLDMDTSDVYDEIVHPTGTECKVRIISVDVGFSEKTESNYWRISLEDATDPHVKRFSYFLWFLGKNMDVRRKNNVKKEFMNFRKAFGFSDSEQLAKSQLPGREAWAILRMKEDEQYGQQNEVKQWIASQG